MPDTADPATSLTCTRRISTTVRERIAGVDEIVVPDLVAAITAELLGDDVFVRQFAREYLRPSVDRLAQGVLASDRSLVRHGSARFLTPAALAALSDDPGDDGALTEAEQRQRKGWLDSFRQFVSERGAVVQLGEMGRADLLSAAALRTERGRNELRLAALFERLAAPLAEGETVRDRWTDADIARLYEQTNVPAKPITLRPAGAKPKAA